MSIQRMKLTGATILVSRGMKLLQAAPAAYPYRSVERRSLAMFALEVVVGQSGIAHDSALRSRLQIVVAVDRHH